MIRVGPRGGRYYIAGSGRKVYLTGNRKVPPYLLKPVPPPVNTKKTYYRPGEKEPKPEPQQPRKTTLPSIQATSHHIRPEFTPAGNDLKSISQRMRSQFTPTRRDRRLMNKRMSAHPAGHRPHKKRKTTPVVYGEDPLFDALHRRAARKF